MSTQFTDAETKPDEDIHQHEVAWAETERPAEIATSEIAGESIPARRASDGRANLVEAEPVAIVVDDVPGDGVTDIVTDAAFDVIVESDSPTGVDDADEGEVAASESIESEDGTVVILVEPEVAGDSRRSRPERRRNRAFDPARASPRRRPKRLPRAKRLPRKPNRQRKPGSPPRNLRNRPRRPPSRKPVRPKRRRPRRNQRHRRSGSQTRQGGFREGGFREDRSRQGVGRQEGSGEKNLRRQSAGQEDRRETRTRRTAQKGRRKGRSRAGDERQKVSGKKKRDEENQREKAGSTAALTAG